MVVAHKSVADIVVDTKDESFLNSPDYDKCHDSHCLMAASEAYDDSCMPNENWTNNCLNLSDKMTFSFKFFLLQFFKFNNYLNI